VTRLPVQRVQLPGFAQQTRAMAGGTSPGADEARAQSGSPASGRCQGAAPDVDDPLGVFGGTPETQLGATRQGASGSSPSREHRPQRRRHSRAGYSRSRSQSRQGTNDDPRREADLLGLFGASARARHLDPSPRPTLHERKTQPQARSLDQRIADFARENHLERRVTRIMQNMLPDDVERVLEEGGVPKQCTNPNAVIVARARRIEKAAGRPNALKRYDRRHPSASMGGRRSRSQSRSRSNARRRSLSHRGRRGRRRDDSRAR